VMVGDRVAPRAQARHFIRACFGRPVCLQGHYHVPGLADGVLWQSTGRLTIASCEKRPPDGGPTIGRPLLGTPPLKISKSTKASIGSLTTFFGACCGTSGATGIDPESITPRYQ